MTAFKDDLTDAVFALCDQGYSNDDILDIVKRCLDQRNLADVDDDPSEANYNPYMGQDDANDWSHDADSYSAEGDDN